MAQHDDLCTALLVLAGNEAPSQERRYAERGEEPGGCGGTVDAFRIAIAAEADALRPVRSDTRVRPGVFADAKDFSQRAPPAADELPRVTVWKRPQEHCVHDAEDRGVRADAEGE